MRGTSGAPLTTAVEEFARAIVALSDEALGREWQGPPGEGVWAGYADSAREFIFQVYLELRQFATLARAERAARGPAMTSAQRILAQHQIAYRDLLGALAGVGDDEIDRPPAADEWPLRRVLAHMMITEYWGFHPQIRHAVDRRRGGQSEPAKVPWDDVLALYGEPEDAYFDAPLPDILTRFDALHGEVLGRFADLTDEELETPSPWWEGYAVPVRFRLHRFDAHLREHTIQVDKTLAGIGHQPREAERLVRLLYGTLGEVEGALLGAADTHAARQRTLAASVAARGEAIARMMAGTM